LAVGNVIGDAWLVAPELGDAEVLSVLRREVLGGRLNPARARAVIEVISAWPLERIPHRVLAPLAWEHHRNVSAYDAFYVATAQLYQLPLITADGRLARALESTAAVQYVHVG
ncbi:MAG: type II toxin-antitoxin system VapC family toxin, partial [Chloroflexi bacterium]|nr:type II toxin-antitoxin system VapC family toxin [Chloroflexota bacterium]